MGEIEGNFMGGRGVSTCLCPPPLDQTIYLHHWFYILLNFNYNNCSFIVMMALTVTTYNQAHHFRFCLGEGDKRPQGRTENKFRARGTKIFF